MLEDLKEVLDEIELQSDWDYNFVMNIVEYKERFPDRALSKKQFSKLDEVHQRYCYGK